MALRGVGTIFSIGDGATPEVFTAVAGVQTINGPTGSAEQIDVSSLDSTGSYREFLAGFKDAGEVSFSIWLDPADRGGLDTLYESGATNNFRITFPDTGSTTLTFAGAVTGFQIGIPTEGAITADTVIKVSGQPTWA